MITCTGVSGMIVTNSLAKDETVAKTLAHLFHPIHFKESGNKYVKHISMKQATPIELKNLETEVDRLLESRASRRVPLCDIRRDVLEDLADEILRQVSERSKKRYMVFIFYLGGSSLPVYTAANTVLVPSSAQPMMGQI